MDDQKIPVVAACNATDEEKARADFVCSGLDDLETLQRALASLGPQGGSILLTNGHYGAFNSKT